MTSDNVFGSHELTPDLVRGARFEEVDGRLDAGEVRAFLDRIASSLEVFMSGDAPTRRPKCPSERSSERKSFTSAESSGGRATRESTARRCDGLIGFSR